MSDGKMFHLVNLRDGARVALKGGEILCIPDGKLAARLARGLTEYRADSGGYYEQADLFREDCDLPQRCYAEAIEIMPGLQGTYSSAPLQFVGGDGGDASGRGTGRYYVVAGDKWQPRLAAREKNWREREAARFENKDYEAVPWASDPDWIRLTAGREPFDTHMLHVSTADPEKTIAYTPDNEYGETDRQLRTTPARYLEKFASSLGKATIARYVAQYQQATLQLVFEITQDEAKILDAYNRGPDSCMKGGASRFFGAQATKNPDLWPHPMAALADGPDLALAIMSRRGAITGRALCWPEKKLYGRIYGGDRNLLLENFQTLGFKEGPFLGARVKNLKLGSEKHGRFRTMAYQDSAMHYAVPKDATGPDFPFWEIVQGSANARDPRQRFHPGARGSVELPTSVTCQKLGTVSWAALDQFSAQRMHTVYLSADRAETWSQAAVDKFAYYCPLSARWVSKETAPSVRALHGGSGLISVAPWHGRGLKGSDGAPFVCPVLGLPALDMVDVLVEIHAIRPMRGTKPTLRRRHERWSMTAARQFAFGDGNGGWVIRDLQSLYPSGRVLSLEAAQAYYPDTVTIPLGKWNASTAHLRPRYEMREDGTLVEILSDAAQEIAAAE